MGGSWRGRDELDGGSEAQERGKDGRRREGTWRCRGAQDGVSVGGDDTADEVAGDANSSGRSASGAGDGRRARDGR